MEGPPVALVASGDLLAAVWHTGPPASPKDQVVQDHS